MPAATGWRILARDIPHPETVAVGPGGDLYTGTALGGPGGPGGRGPVMRVDPRSGRARPFVDTGGRVLGIASGPGGPDGPDAALVLCDVVRAELVWVDPAGRRLRTVTSAGGTRLLRPNGCVVDEQGGTWFTDSGTATAGEPTGAVCYVPPGGGECVVAASGLVYPNGIGLTPDGSVLLVTLTRDDALVAFDVAGPGRLGGSRRVTGGLAHGPDGLWVTPDGTVLIAVTRTSRIVSADLSGRVDVIAEDPDVFRMPSHVTVWQDHLLVPSLFGSTIAAGPYEPHTSSR